jgi:predicted metalloprotease with PDZ domain
MKKSFLSALVMVWVLMATAQKVSYLVSFPNAVHHEAEISLTVSGIPLTTAQFRMSRSSPGRYATHEFGKNVYDVKATDANGKPLSVVRADGDVYEVPLHQGTVTLSYTLYGNYADGTYAGIDPESIHLNMPAAFMWMQGLEKAPITIRFVLPKENRGIVATQLVTTADPYTFTAPGLQYFMDSPTKIGDIQFREWPLTNPDGSRYTMRIALEAKANQTQFDELAEKVKKMVTEARAVFGEFPKYDYGSYTFIASANPYVHGDGMEHRNSTMISIPMSSFSAGGLLGVFSHEYFHNWNVERIRPKTLEPFRFDKSNMSHELWFAEGFTQYYGELLLARAGLSQPPSYLYQIASLINTKQNTPGGKFYSPVQASNHAVFVDAAVSIDRNNYANMFSSYYTYGAAIALALDLEMQTKYQKTLDVFMQAMWKRFGKTETAYTISGMQETLASVTDNRFATAFFNQYINGHEMIDYAGLLAKAGYDLVKTGEGKAWLGANTRATGSKLVIGSNTVKGSPAYEAGLDIDDEILKLDETTVKSPIDINGFLSGKKPGEAITVTYKHRDTEKQTRLVLGENASISVAAFEQSGKPVTAAMQQIRDSWFSSRVK